MKVRTSRFGEIDVPDSALITFPQGVVGFPGATRFVLFDCGEEGVFKWLQSVDRPELAFVLCEAGLVKPDYRVPMSAQEQELLGIESAEDAAVCLILTLAADPAETTANLLGPIVMNAETRLGMQLVLVEETYTTRYRVFAPQEGAGSATGDGAGGAEEAGHAGA
jgi:flagellar assembly factor FliW